ncbi:MULTISPECIES: alpha/beta fold hydrolase [Bradyrhizobium]|uniref:alpha/beta fold hydrolase n=1 Tax=Bradyrhizobium TaxID=374 RepID=UPI0004B45864|nr:alpha/beta fold hydrolase [Bradyrhizobium elkanii]WLA82988.1 alpha/beta fold hydrolase [Bradyrhizobium elkanii]
MKPVVFADTIGWLNEAKGRRGVVIAGAHGHEDLCSRRFLKLLSDKAAAAGLPTLLFDYPGCGNAAGDHAAPGQVMAWTASIGAAIDRLKRDCGVEDVILAGFRLGALLAPLAAAGRDDVAGLALLAPPSSGKTYVREITAMSRVIDGALAKSAASEATFAEGREAVGFRLSHETLADLSRLDWRRAVAALPPLPTLLIANGQRLAVSEIRDGRTSVESTTIVQFKDYHLLMCDPTANRIPADVVGCWTDWLSDRAVAGAVQRVESLPGREVLEGSHYTEEPVVIGQASSICGVLTRPRGSHAAADPVIFLNSGGVPHVGWARGTVEAARELAAAGVASLRIDLPGIGLSDDAASDRLFLYDSSTRLDVSAAIDWMQRAGFAKVELVGTCSGAFQALHTARADRRVRALTMINPLCFAWNSSYALELTAWKAYETSKANRGSQQQIGPAEGPEMTAKSAWKLSVSDSARRLVRRGLEAVKSTLSATHPSALLGRNRVERWMRELCSRDVRVLMVTSDGDLSLQEIARHFGQDGKRLTSIPGVTRLTLPNADHSLTPRHARRAVVASLIDRRGGKRGGSIGPDAARAIAPHTELKRKSMALS